MLSPVVIDTMVWNRETREASGKERRRGGGTPRESTLSLHLLQDSTHSSNTLAIGGQKAFKKPFNKDWCDLQLSMRGFLDHTMDLYAHHQ